MMMMLKSEPNLLSLLIFMCEAAVRVEILFFCIFLSFHSEKKKMK